MVFVASDGGELGGGYPGQCADEESELFSAANLPSIPQPVVDAITGAVRTLSDDKLTSFRWPPTRLVHHLSSEGRLLLIQ